MSESAIAEIGRHVCYNEGGRDEESEMPMVDGGADAAESTLEEKALEAGETFGWLMMPI